MSKVEAIVNVLGEDFPEQKPPRGLEAIHPVSWSLALETRRVLWQAREGVPEKLEPSALVRLLPGRFQAVDLMISGRKGKVILDVAHNPQAFERLFDLLVRRGKRYHVVCGMMRDKAPPEALGRFANCVRGWHVASLPGPRGAEASLLAGRLDVPASRYDSVSEALDSAWNALEPDEELVVCGSFVTVELALQWIDKRKDYDSTSE
jgi:folylpolyglutamate synthase/dihydropteroate synthase